MARVDTSVKKLKAGEHYGPVFHTRHTETAVFSETVYQRSISLPEHSHELGFFTLILDGFYSETRGSTSVVYSPRTVLWRQAEQSHKDKIEAASSRFFFVEIGRTFAERLDQCERVPDHLFEKNGPLTWMASRLRSEIIAGDASSPLIVDGITLEMLGLLVRSGYSNERRAPRWLGRVISRLNEEYAQTVSSERLAADAGVHPVHLASVFRKFQNETVGDYLQKRRVERALELLADKNIPLVEIALQCGFADQSHFTRVFRRRVGMTPGTYRTSLL